MRVVDRDTLSPHDANLLAEKTYWQSTAPFQGQRTSGYPLIGLFAQIFFASLSIASQEVASIRRDDVGMVRFFRLTLVGERGNLPLVVAATSRRQPESVFEDVSTPELLLMRCLDRIALMITRTDNPDEHSPIHSRKTASIAI